MADKTIGDLPAAAAIYDDDLFLLEQSGEAKKLRGALYKAYLQGFVDAAAAASEEAAAALAGVRDAINNIPEGAATPIVNDLTTGGTSMALSAEVGKKLKGELDGLNPPMQLGIEYRTTERSEGKPVYAKRIKYTPGVSITTGTQVSIPHEISGFDSLVRITGRANQFVLPYVNKDGQQSGVSEVNTKYIIFECFGGTWSTNYNFYFNLYYTKTTN